MTNTKFHLAFCRIFITVSSILLFLLIGLFFSLARTFDFPASHEEALSVVKQVSPVFIGYIGQSAYHLISKKTNALELETEKNILLYVITVSPFAIFSVLFTAIVYAFWHSNRLEAIPGTGMYFNQLSDWITILLGLFAATISILTAWLFSKDNQ